MNIKAFKRVPPTEASGPGFLTSAHSSREPNHGQHNFFSRRIDAYSDSASKLSPSDLKFSVWRMFAMKALTFSYFAGISYLTVV
jgi:hypothetical protein